jgi:hypothetical protein
MSTQIYEEFINTFDRERMLPGRIRPQLSTQHYECAREAIKKVINDGEESAILGFTSGGLCSHILVRTESGELYIVHNAYGNLNDAYYLTPYYVKDIFEGFENEMPIWKPSERIQTILNNE